MADDLALYPKIEITEDIGDAVRVTVTITAPHGEVKHEKVYALAGFRAAEDGAGLDALHREVRGLIHAAMHQVAVEWCRSKKDELVGELRVHLNGS